MPLGPCWFQPTTTWEHILWIGYPRAPGSGSPPPEQPVQVSEAPTTDQAPPTPVEVPTDSRQGKKLMILRPRTRTRIREKARPQILPSLSPSKLLTQKLPRQKLRTLVLLIHLFSLFTAFVCFFFRHVFHPRYQWSNGKFFCCHFISFFFIWIVRTI